MPQGQAQASGMARQPSQPQQMAAARPAQAPQQPQQAQQPASQQQALQQQAKAGQDPAMQPPAMMPGRPPLSARERVALRARLAAEYHELRRQAIEDARRRWYYSQPMPGAYPGGPSYGRSGHPGQPGSQDQDAR